MNLKFLNKLPLFGYLSGKSESYLGVDIGTASIKIAEIGMGDKPRLKNYGILETRGHLDRANSAIQTSGLKLLDVETSEMLKRIVSEMKPSTKNAVASLPAFTAFTSLVELPVMSKEETSQAMYFQAKAFVPLPLTEVTIDWIPVKEYENDKGIKKQQVFLISIPNEYIQKYQNIFSGAGLVLRELEVETVSSARILTAGDPTVSLIVDIGARSTAIAVASSGTLRYSAQTDFAGGSLTQAVSRGLNINIQRAEDLKKSRGLTGSGGEYELSTLMAPYLDVILKEARRVRDVYERSYGDKIERAILSGGGANLLGIEKYAESGLGLPVVKAHPLRGFSTPTEIATIVETLSPQLSVSLGLSAKRQV